MENLLNLGIASELDHHLSVQEIWNFSPFYWFVPFPLLWFLNIVTLPFYVLSLPFIIGWNFVMDPVLLIAISVGVFVGVGYFFYWIINDVWQITGN